MRRFRRELRFILVWHRGMMAEFVSVIIFEPVKFKQCFPFTFGNFGNDIIIISVLFIGFFFKQTRIINLYFPSVLAGIFFLLKWYANLSIALFYNIKYDRFSQCLCFYLIFLYFAKAINF